MNIIKDRVFTILVYTVCIISVMIMAVIVFFIFQESRDYFKQVSFLEFIKGSDWSPVSNPPQFSILPMIAGTLISSLLAVLMALPIGVCCALYLSTCNNRIIRMSIKWIVDLLAGIPSVIIGLIGLTVLVKLLEYRFSFAAGECILVASILLAVMILPYIISTSEESMRGLYIKYKESSMVLGTDKWYMIRELILPASVRGIIASVILAIGRAMGETMAVMMVIGNANIFPKILGKGQTISTLIALEMGSAQVDSLHYHALYAAGLVLMILLIIINLLFYIVKRLLLR